MVHDNLKQRLMVLRDTLRRACAINGTGRLVAVLCVCLLAGVFLDYSFFRWDSAVNTFFRVLMTAGILGGLGWIGWKYLVAPLQVPFSVDDMALAVEKEFPELNDSLISTMQLARMVADDKTVSSPMVQEVARQAFQQTAPLDFNRVVKFDRVKPVLYAAGGALALFVLICAIPSMQPVMKVGLLRLLNPFSNEKYPVRTFIASGAPEVPWPKNESLRISAELSGEIPSKAEIMFDHGSGYGKKEPITTFTTLTDPATGETKKVIEYEYNPVISSFKYVILAGDNQTDVHTIRAVDRPELINLTAFYELPKYISDASIDTTDSSKGKRERNLRAVAGTNVTLVGEVNKPLQSAAIKLGEATPEELDFKNIVRDENGERVEVSEFRYTLTLDNNADYEITLLDKDNLDNRHNKIRHRIYKVADSLPRVNWKAPAMNLEVTPQAKVALEVSAADDWGLQKTGIKFKRKRMIVPAAGGNTPPTPPPAGDKPPGPAESNSSVVEGGFDLAPTEPDTFSKQATKLEFAYAWQLADLGLQPGDEVEYWAEAYDWCPTPRKALEAEVFKLMVLSPEELRRKLDIERLHLIEELKVIIRDQEADKKLVESIKEHLSFGNAFDDNQRSKVSDAGSLQEEVRRKTASLQNAFENLIGRYVSNGLDTPEDIARLDDVSKRLGVQHGTRMPDAAKNINAASPSPDLERPEVLRQAITKQEAILAELKDLLEQMQKWAETEELIRLARDLLVKQRKVTKETDGFKDKLAGKKATATNEEKASVLGLEHSQKDCSNDMKQLFDRMTQAMAKLMAVDKFAARNVGDAIKIANGDVGPNDEGNPNAGISTETKMRGAQGDINKYEFGQAGGRQRASETDLDRIITVLSRRPEPDEKTLRELKDVKKQLEKALAEQRKLKEQTKSLQEKADLQRSIAEAKAKLKDLVQQQERLLNSTKDLQNKPDNNADQYQADLDKALKDLDALIEEQSQVFQETAKGLTPPELELARAIHELEELEIKERGYAKESAAYSDDRAAKLLREQHGKVKALRQKQEALIAKTAEAQKLPDAAKATEALKALQPDQTKLEAETREVLAGLEKAGKELTKDLPKDSPREPILKALAAELQQAGTQAYHAPNEMKQAAEQMGANKSNDALETETRAKEKLARAEETLLKALGLEHKQFEDALFDIANRQAETRAQVDEIANRVKILDQAGKTPERVANDPGLAAASKGAAQAMPDLEGARHEMGDAADTIRQGAPKGEKESAKKGSDIQTSAADKLAKARAALQAAADELAKSKKEPNAKIGEKQGQTQAKAKALQEQINKLSDGIEKSHAAAQGAPEPKPGSDPSGASGKMGEAGDSMGKAKNDLAKPDPTNATKNQSRAIDQLEEAKKKLAGLKEKIDELKTPSRRLTREQKEAKDKARELAKEIAGLEDQLPKKEGEKPAAENVGKASNNMQNAQNSLDKMGDGKKGEQGDPKSGDQKSGQEGDPKGGQQGDPKGGQQGDPKGGNPEEEKKNAAKEQQEALDKLKEAMKSMEDLEKKAEAEKDPRVPEALARLKEPQTLQREQVEKLRARIDALKDKTSGKSTENLDKSSRSTKSASSNQSQAAGQMGQGSQSGAQSSEEEAEKDLQEALDNLEEAEKQMEQQKKQEQLFQIEQELKRMVAEQKELLTRTVETEKKRDAEGKLPRPAAGPLKTMLVPRQKELAKKAKEVAVKLAEAPVFEWVIQSASEDMTEAGNLLDTDKTSALTQEIQEDALKKLNDLIEALRKERTKPPPGGGGGGGGGGGKQPLVPPLAELKMLQIRQRDVNVSVKRINDEATKVKQENGELSRDQKARLRRSAVKEGEIARITDKIAKSLNGNGAPPPPTLPGENGPAPDGDEGPK